MSPRHRTKKRRRAERHRARRDAWRLLELGFETLALLDPKRAAEARLRYKAVCLFARFADGFKNLGWAFDKALDSVSKLLERIPPQHANARSVVKPIEYIAIEGTITDA